MGKGNQKANQIAITTVMAPPPAYLSKFCDGAGVKELETTATIPRLRIVQSMSDTELKDAFGEGAVILKDDAELIAEKEKPFSAIPIIYYESFEQWRDVNDAANASPIVAATMNRTSVLADRAMQRLIEPYPDNGKLSYSYRHCLNLILLLLDAKHRAGGQCIYTWMRGEFKLGTGVVGFLRRRLMVAAKPDGTTPPIFSLVLSLHSEPTKNRKSQSWYVLNVDRDAVGDKWWTPEALMPGVRDLYLAAKESRDHGRVDAPTAEGAEG